ncbi:hypothetical protein AX16_010812 [Volvariella volvacea WC 439]|nr:hypothetical protein AX16_010812 [Volvariella volvacea WC 439]
MMEPFEPEPYVPGESLMGYKFYLHGLADQGLIPPPRHEVQKRHIFLYGTLTLPHVLKKVLGLKEEPNCPKAYVLGYAFKMWGPHPALIRLNAVSDRLVKAEGKTWFGDEHDLNRLQLYLGRKFKYENNPVLLEGRDLSAGWVFVWDGDDNELHDGAFDPSQFDQSSDEE